MQKCWVELADVHGDAADLLLEIVQVPVGLFLETKSFLRQSRDVTSQIAYFIGPNFG